MAKILLSAYVIGITILLLMPSWISISAVLANHEANWRTWAELIRSLLSGWLLFVVPGVIAYILIALLPQWLANLFSRKETARQQAQLQARASALNPRDDTADPQLQAEEEIVNEIAGSEETDAEGIDDTESSFLKSLWHCLFGVNPIGSNTLWRLSASLLLFPLLGSLLAFLLLLVLELEEGPGGHFMAELMGVILLCAYFATLPLLACWLISELLLRRFPQWFAIPLRHYSISIALGMVIALVARQLDPTLAELSHTYFPYASYLFAACLGIFTGIGLAMLYRLPMRLTNGLST